MTWPSLKKLTLWGKLDFTDGGTSQDEAIDSYLSFFARHPKLERLYVLVLYDGHGIQLPDELTRRLSPVLPSLRSLRCSCFIPPDILSRLVHVTNWTNPTDHYAIARSLRSCCVVRYIEFDDLQVVVEAMPRQLERLSVSIKTPPDIELLLDRLPKKMSSLINLTHLEIRIDFLPSHYVDDPRCHLEAYLTCLPSLIYFRFGTYRSVSFTSWGDFFKGPFMWFL